jgi:tetratricopeptide (TPR) repeat protein
LAFQERVAARVAATITRPFGPIFNQEVVRATRAPPEQLDTYDCVLKYRYYRRSFDPGDHRQTADCFRRAVVREPGLADAWAGLALVYLDEYLYGYNPDNGPVDALTRAREAAIKACDIEGDNRLAVLALARVRLADGDLNGFDRATERLLALTPHNADDLATLGALRGVTEDWERSLPLLDEALALYAPGRAPGVFFIAHALHALETGDYEQALDHALKIDTPSWPLISMVVAASAGLAGRTDIAHRAAQRLLELQPDFPSRVRAQLARWHPREAVVARLVEGMNAAGLDIP